RSAAREVVLQQGVVDELLQKTPHLAPDLLADVLVVDLLRERENVLDVELPQRNPGSGPRAPTQINEVTIGAAHAPPTYVALPSRLEHDAVQTVLNDLDGLARLRLRGASTEDHLALRPLREELNDVLTQEVFRLLERSGRLSSRRMRGQKAAKKCGRDHAVV